MFEEEVFVNIKWWVIEDILKDVVNSRVFRSKSIKDVDVVDCEMLRIYLIGFFVVVLGGYESVFIFYCCFVFVSKG